MTRVGDDTGSPTTIEDQLLEAKRQIETLQQALVSRSVIDQAKGVLMAVHQVDPDAAFEMLSSVSQTENLKVSRLAQAIVALAARRAVEDSASESAVRTRLLAGQAVRSGS